MSGGPAIGLEGVEVAADSNSLVRVGGVTLEAVSSAQGNGRFAVRLADGQLVEAVLYPRSGRPGETTLCVSSQVGCGVGCPFCASGAFGLSRPLALAELVAQVEGVGALLRARGESPPGSVTLSGVGEPLHNPASAEFLGWCAARRLPLSLTTSGGPLGRLREWLQRPHQGLTLSVHAGSESVRAQMVPGGPALGPLFETVAGELPRLSRKRRKRTALAYLLVANRNDSAAEVDAFIERAQPLGLPVHLFAFNAVSTSSERPVAEERYQEVYSRMVAAGVAVRRSSRQRRAANGGCGTLVAELRRGARVPRV